MPGRRAGTLVYSPLCDVDLIAYTRYLESNVAARGGGLSSATGDCGRCARQLGSGGVANGGTVESSDITSGADGGSTRGCVVSRGAVGVLRSFIASEIQESVRLAVERKHEEAFGRPDKGSGERLGVDARAGGVDEACGGGLFSDGQFAASGASSPLNGEGDGDLQVEAKEKLPVPVSAGVSGKVVEESGKYVPPHARGQEVVRGKHYASNKAARERRKRDKGAVRDGQVEASALKADYGTFAACSLDQREELQRTRAQRLVAENELKTAEAQRKLELLRAQDVAQLKKRQETKLMRDTELNKVQVEQAFSKLAGTGNVPGFAQTVVTDGSVPSLQSGSISPNSSISAAEVHAMQKEILEFRRREEIIARREPELYAEVVAAKLASVQTGWTVDEDGRPTGWIGDGVGGMIGPDGRLHDYDDYAEY